ncbi:MAG: LuxR family transcriptional regulator [Methanobacteriota archaeon]|nr:MAG: LuxR family transcriptional regulator [Euryarchaeota archaeon]
MEFASSILDQQWVQAGNPNTAQPSRPLTPNQAAKLAFSGLTAREREVAALISQGKNNAQIAGSLFLSVRAVEAHVTRILTKLGYSSRSQIAVWAASKGLGAREEGES